jgi:uncharacterized membrane protein YfcA
MEFSWLTAVSLFLFYVFVDVLYVLYTRYITEKRAFATANAGALLYALLAYGTVQYVQNNLYIIPVVLGSWIGAYFTVKFIK